ncbi:MAG: radical SAM protein [Candidatus Paceibacterota bacterium]
MTVKLLLTNLPSNKDSIFFTSYYPMLFPLSLNTLKGYLVNKMKEQVKVEIFNFHNEQKLEQLKDLIKSQEFDFIGISACLDQMESLEYLLNILFRFNKLKNTFKVIVGNNIVKYKKEYLLRKYPSLFLVENEGESALLNLIINNTPILKKIPNLSYKLNGSVINNKISRFNIDDCQVPSIDYLKETINFGGKVYLETSRGCSWGKCTFCLKNNINRGWRSKKLDLIVNILNLYKNNGVKKIIVTDEDFIGTNFQRITELANIIIKNKYQFDFRISVKVRDIYSNNNPSINLKSFKALKLLKKARVSTIYLGIESGCDSQLIRYNKGVTSYENLKAIEKILKLGFVIKCGFIMFDPFLSLNELIANLHFINNTTIGYCFDVGNKMLLTDENDIFLKKIKDHNLYRGIIGNNVYHQWNFLDSTVEEIYSHLNKWQNSRKIYSEYFTLNDLTKNRIKDFKIHRFFLEFIKDTSNIFDRAFLIFTLFSKYKIFDKELMQDITTETIESVYKQIQLSDKTTFSEIIKILINSKYYVLIKKTEELMKSKKIDLDFYKLVICQEMTYLKNIEFN